MTNILPVETDRPSQVPSSNTSGMTGKVVKGSIWVLIGQVLPLVATFVSTPFVIRLLGSESYGVLLLLGLISSYFSVADFGMGLTSTKFGSAAYAEGNSEKEGRIVRMAAVIATGSSLLIIIPMFFFSQWLVVDLFEVPKNLRAQANIGLKLTAIAFFFSILSGVFNTPQLSRMRMDLNILINAGSKILMTLVTPVVLYLGGGIIEATIVALVATFATFAINFLVSGRLLPTMKKFSIGREYFRPLIKFGGSIVLYGIGLTLINYLERFFVARFVSVTSLAYYSVAATFAVMTTMFSTAMVQSLLPAFSQMLHADKRNELLLLFMRMVRISFICLIPAIMLLVVIAKPFFTVWAGRDFGENSVYPYYILLLGIFFGMAAYIPNCILMASGRSNLFARFYLFELVPYAIVSYFLVLKLGIIGAAIAFSLRETVNSLVFIKYVRKHMGESFDVWKDFSKYLFGFLIFIPMTVYAIVINNFSLWLIIIIPVSLVTYTWVAWKNFITKEEKDWANRLKYKIKRRMGWVYEK